MERVIVIEDDFIFCKLLSNFLQKNGMQSEQASNGLEGKEMISNRDFDLAIIDYRLPDINGVELTKWIKGEFPEMKVLVMSRMDDQNIPIEANEAGAEGFIQKPFKPNQILELLEEL